MRPKDVRDNFQAVSDRYTHGHFLPLAAEHCHGAILSSLFMAPSEVLSQHREPDLFITGLN